MADAFLWWLALLGLGLAALPISQALFRYLPDRGYALSRPLGLLIVSFLFWWLGTIHVIPISRLGVFAAFLMLVAIAAALALRRRKSLAEFVRREWRVMLVTEALFASVFIVWGVIRSYTPGIVHTEQPMDFAFLNGILQSPGFPPRDPWFAGQPISYYYGGHFHAAVLTRLTGIPSGVAYNLSLMSTAAMAATGIASIAYNLVRTLVPVSHAGTALPMRRHPRRFRGAVVAGMAAVVLLLFTANLVGILEFFRIDGVGSTGFFRWIHIDGLTFAPGAATWYPSDTWWWWRATRVINTFVQGSGIDYTITEFPFFSFLLGDMHPHVMSLPFTLLAIGLSYNVLRSRPMPGLHWLRTQPWVVLPAALVLGNLGFINTWDLPTFGALFLAALLLRAFHGRARGEPVSMLSTLGLGVAIGLAAVALFAPFYLHLGGQASGILPLRRVMTRPLHLFIVLGPLLLLNVTLLAALAWDGFRKPAIATFKRSIYFWAAAVPLVPFALWSLAELGMTLAGSRKLLRPENTGSFAEALLSIGSRFWHLLPFIFLIGLALALIFRRAAEDRGRSAAVQFALLLMLFGLMLVMGTDLFYVADFFGNRMNTVFKLYYQAWVLLAIGGAVSLYYWYTRPVQRAWPRSLAVPGLMGLFAVMLAASLVYVPAAAYDKTGHFKGEPTLDGLAYFAASAPGEYQATRWLIAHAGPDARLVEALPGSGGQPGGDYDASVGRFSGSTGIPTILGWPGHEHQWRGNPYDPIAERYRDVDAVYRSGDNALVAGVLAKYRVTYVIVGGFEQQTYGPQVGSKFARFMDIVFKDNGVVIYRVREGS